MAGSSKEIDVVGAAPRVGHRFHGDFQGIENWTTDGDVREFLASINIKINFRFEPYRGGILFSPSLKRREIRTIEPLFYLVERGGNEESLESGLLQQADEVGVKLEFNSRRWKVDEGGVIAVGPRAADMIPKGMVFESDLADGIKRKHDEF